MADVVARESPTDKLFNDDILLAQANHRPRGVLRTRHSRRRTCGWVRGSRFSCREPGMH